MKRACIVHDVVNLWLLPVIGAMTVAGVVQAIDPAIVTWTFLAYIVADFVWVLVQPEAVPSLPGVILVHHAVTFVLLCFPLRYPHLHLYTCIDGLVELNTFFLIARRQWRSARKVFSYLYWLSFFPMRMILYPALVPVFLREFRSMNEGGGGGAAWWETLLCVGAQFVLCGFNILLLTLSVMNWRKRGGGGRAVGSGGSGKAGPGGDKGAVAMPATAELVAADKPSADKPSATAGAATFALKVHAQ